MLQCITEPCNVIASGSMQHTATHCNTLQHITTHCNTLQHTATHCNTLQHTATHCNTQHRTSTNCKTLRHTATHYNTLHQTHCCHTRTHTHLITIIHTQPIPTHCNTLQHTTTHCNTLQHTATHCNTLHCTSTHCNALQRTVMQCNKLQRTTPHTLLSHLLTNIHTWTILSNKTFKCSVCEIFLSKWDVAFVKLIYPNVKFSHLLTDTHPNDPLEKDPFCFE